MTPAAPQHNTAAILHRLAVASVIVALLLGTVMLVQHNSFTPSARVSVFLSQQPELLALLRHNGIELLYGDSSHTAAVIGGMEVACAETRTQRAPYWLELERGGVSYGYLRQQPDPASYRETAAIAQELLRDATACVAALRQAS